MSGFSEAAGSVEALRALYRAPTDIVRGKIRPALDDAMRRYISFSPFCLLATADAGGRATRTPACCSSCRAATRPCASRGAPA
jgi:predicted pyridoxine 5'-phosphate oxidase superfamily flavin-nucleotide-binding protein